MGGFRGNYTRVRPRLPPMKSGLPSRVHRIRAGCYLPYRLSRTTTTSPIPQNRCTDPNAARYWIRYRIVTWQLLVRWNGWVPVARSAWK